MIYTAYKKLLNYTEKLFCIIGKLEGPDLDGSNLENSVLKWKMLSIIKVLKIYYFEVNY